MSADLTASLFVFWFGAIIGSFLNVCIYRMPRDISVVMPRSACPNCKAMIPWYWNIPLLSFLWLRGKCGRCKRAISIRYFLVELVSGFSWWFLWRQCGFSTELFSGIVFFSMLLVVIVTDFETGLIPDQITIPGMIAGLVFSVIGTEHFPQAMWYQRLGASALGLLGGGAVLFVIGWFGKLVFRKESMGGGDIKLLAMVGSFIGLTNVGLVFLLAPFPALPFALWQRFVKKEETIPFGPFLALVGALFFMHAGPIRNLIAKAYGV